MSPILSLTQEGNKKESSLNDQLDRKSGCQSIAPDSGEVGQAKRTDSTRSPIRAHSLPRPSSGQRRDARVSTERDFRDSNH